MNVFEHIEKNKPTLNIQELLLLAIAQDTRKMLVMAEANQKYIEQVANGGLSDPRDIVD
jgi:hypothetical protein